MAIQNFDVEFEEYIIFHRGIQEVSFNQGDNHLHIIYQDGYDQDLGDPLGDRVTQAEQAGNYAAEVETELRALQSTLDEKLTNATNLSIDAEAKYDEVVQIGNEVRNASAYINDRLDNLFENAVIGIGKDSESGKYYVDLSSYSTTKNVQSDIDTWIRNIDGIEPYKSGDKDKYYINPFKTGSRTTDAISSMIGDKLTEVSGIIYDASRGRYYVDLSEDAITAAEIHALFI